MKNKYFYNFSQINALLLISLLPVFISGCSSFLETQPPAPVYGGTPEVHEETPPPIIPPKPVEPPQQPVQKPQDIVITAPLKSEQTPIKPVEIRQKPKPKRIEPEESEQNIAALEPTMPTVEPPPPPPPTPPFVPLESFDNLSPAVGTLVVAANTTSKSGNYDAATTTIERAIRIEPRNAALYYNLALLRLKQNKPRLAEDLAKKSAQLAGKDNSLKKHSWLLAAEAREQQNNPDGAKEAREKAEKY